MGSSNAAFHLSARLVLIFGRSVSIAGGAVDAITPIESSEADVPNVELIVETVTSCERSSLSMGLPDRHLAFEGANHSALPSSSIPAQLCTRSPSFSYVAVRSREVGQAVPQGRSSCAALQDSDSIQCT